MEAGFARDLAHKKEKREQAPALQRTVWLRLVGLARHNRLRFAKFGAVGACWTDSSKLGIERLRTAWVAGCLSGASCTEKAIEAVGGVRQDGPVLGECLARALEQKEHVGEHFTGGDANGFAATLVLMVGGGAHPSECFVGFSLGESQPGFGFAQVGSLFAGDRVALLLGALLAVGNELRQLVYVRLRAGDVTATGGADGTGPKRRVIPVLVDGGNRQSGGFFPSMQFQSSSGGKIGALIGFAFITCADDVAGVLDHFPGFGFLTALEIGVAEEVHGVSLVMGFSEVHLRGVSAGRVSGNIRGDGILPQAKADEDVRGHVYGVGGVRGDGGVTAGGFESLSREFGTID